MCHLETRSFDYTLKTVSLKLVIPRLCSTDQNFYNTNKQGPYSAEISLSWTHIRGTGTPFAKITLSRLAEQHQWTHNPPKLESSHPVEAAEVGTKQITVT